MSTTATTPKPMSKGSALATALAGKIAPSSPSKASMEVYSGITRSKPARVLLNTHVMTMLNVMVVMVNIRQVPQGPQHAQDNRREKRPVMPLHAGKGEAPPAPFLASVTQSVPAIAVRALGLREEISLQPPQYSSEIHRLLLHLVIRNGKEGSKVLETRLHRHHPCRRM
jgi:hypothetical protein